MDPPCSTTFPLAQKFSKSWLTHPQNFSCLNCVTNTYEAIILPHSLIQFELNHIIWCTFSTTLYIFNFWYYYICNYFVWFTELYEANKSSNKINYLIPELLNKFFFFKKWKWKSTQLIISRLGGMLGSRF